MSEQPLSPPVLDVVEQRVLGSLLEKQRTVPAGYPLTLSALRSACNQTSSRDPVLDLDDQRVEQAARALRERGLLRIVWSDTGRRTLKYHQILDEVLGLSPPERALLTVLLLRGPQSPGELRARTERLYAFPDREAVEQVLGVLAGREQPLVAQLERRPGQQDRRWVHLLGEVVPAPAGPAPVAPELDREGVLRDGEQARTARVRAAWDALAEPYAQAMSTELDPASPADLAFERWLLDRVAAHGAGRPVVEVGCGPGHVTAYLAAAGAQAQGLDLSPGMVDVARARHPELTFGVGDLRDLMRPATGSGWAAVLAWYSLIHLAGSEIPAAVAALARPLLPGGLLVLALHAGSGIRHLSSWFDVPVDLDVVRHDPGAVRSAAAAAGLVDLEWYLRGPLSARGESTERFYLLARSPC